MAQAGMHAMVGMAVRTVTKPRPWLLLGVLLGSILPDLDNFGVAAATLAKMPVEGIHRSLTHSLFFALLVGAVFYLNGQMTREEKWTGLGLGLGAGILMHILLDLLLWFNGVSILWPVPLWVDLWTHSSPPALFMKFMDPFEFLMFGAYLWALRSWSARLKTDADFLPRLSMWMWIEFALFVLFTPLAFVMTRGFQTVYGAVYLFSITMTFLVTIRLRATLDAAQGELHS